MKKWGPNLISIPETGSALKGPAMVSCPGALVGSRRPCRPAVFYGSETRCLKEKEMGILKRPERAMVRVMFGAKLADRQNTEDMIDMLGLNQTIVKMAKANGVKWMGHVLKKEDGDVVRNASEFNVEGRKKRGRPKRTWRKQVEEERLKASLNLKDAHNITNWREKVRAISMRSIRPPPLNGNNTG